MTGEDTSTAFSLSHKADVYPETPDGRYFVVKGRLWRKSVNGGVKTGHLAAQKSATLARA